MSIRKNARLLSSTEKENFVRACVLMKADIVNPGAAAAQQYSRWDENTALHLMIQQAFAPGAANVNFGHGSGSSWAFLSWHRYFLHRVELQLQSYVPGVTIPYWDWTNPTTGADAICVDGFLGPDAGGGVVGSGYFAVNKPGSGGNPTALPAWWPATLAGWRCPDAFPATWRGGLQRAFGGSLPSIADLHGALEKATYAAFQGAMERGTGLASGHQMHNAMHGWIDGHMGNPTASPFDPLFYLHHCNIDRLWAMWQADGHATEYPLSGGNPHHNRNDLMYPWTGGAAGYGTNHSIQAAIPMPDFSALGAQTNGSTLDYRTAYGYTYDTIAIIGIGLDRTGSMNGLTPDPMTTSSPDVTKWEAAKRGVSAFLQDCETVQASGATFVIAGVKTFRRTGANLFDNVFAGTGYGLVRTGGTVSKATFDAAISALSPGGSTPLADALADVRTTLVEAPFGGAPADEQRYLAMLTDGLLTSGAPMSSIPDGSFGRTAVFGMGFGTGAEVDYATIASLVAKGRTLTTNQIFHGENAGTIDKFYTNALASAIGFTAVFDPVIELFAGEHIHMDHYATSADDHFLITAQGMDFDDDNWTFLLIGPGGRMLYGEGQHSGHGDDCHHCCPEVTITARRSNARLTLMVSRGHTSTDCWVGKWQLMIAYKARKATGMVMPEIGEWLFPVSAGPVRGARFSRLLMDPQKRIAKRNVIRPALHGLDTMPVSTNSDGREACDVVVNIYARTRLRIELLPRKALTIAGEALAFDLHMDLAHGSVSGLRAFARTVSPMADLAQVFKALEMKDAPEQAELKGSEALRFDPAKILAWLEERDPRLTMLRDEEAKVVVHGDGPMHVHLPKAEVGGRYHIGFYVDGFYCPQHGKPEASGHAHAAPAALGAHGADAAANGCGPDCRPERFTRLLTSSAGVVTKGK